MLKKNYRITKEKEFQEFFGKKFKDNKGRNFSTPKLVLKIFPNQLKNARFAIIVSNKVDNRAVVRNKIRRQIREVLRLNYDNLKASVDGLFVVQKALAGVDNSGIKKEALTLLQKANLL